MRLLFWYCDRFAWHPSLKVLDHAPEAIRAHEQTVVIFIHVEPPDVTGGSSAETKPVKNAKWLARKWETLKIVLDSFKPTCHIFYGMRVIDIRDDLPKWSGHKNHSTRL